MFPATGVQGAPGTGKIAVGPHRAAVRSLTVVHDDPMPAELAGADSAPLPAERG